MGLGTNPRGVELLLRWNPDGAIVSRLCALSTVKKQCRRGFRAGGNAEVRAAADVEDAGCYFRLPSYSEVHPPRRMARLA